MLIVAELDRPEIGNAGRVDALRAFWQAVSTSPLARGNRAAASPRRQYAQK
jgi:hypothetical protein